MELTLTDQFKIVKFFQKQAYPIVSWREDIDRLTDLLSKVGTDQNEFDSICIEIVWRSFCKEIADLVQVGQFVRLRKLIEAFRTVKLDDIRVVYPFGHNIPLDVQEFFEHLLKGEYDEPAD